MGFIWLHTEQKKEKAANARKILNIYEIRHHSEESYCQNCGSPLYVGDTIYRSRASDIAYCSTRCFNDAESIS